MNSEIIKRRERLASQARRSIWKYCYEECNAYCCRKGYLVLNLENVMLVTQGKLLDLEREKLIKYINKGQFSLYMGKNEKPCPSLKDNKCMIHDSRKRPKVCQEFPVFIDGDTLKVSSRCLAVKEGKLYPYIYQLLQTGMVHAKHNGDSLDLEASFRD